MSKFNLSKAARSVRTALSKHSPEILTGLGVAGLIASTVMAVTATPKALKYITDKKEELGVDKLTKTETVKAAWKPYIPAAITTTASVICIIGANSINSKRRTALTAAYSMSETAFREYRRKVVETIGEKKEESIRDSISKSKIETNPIDGNEVIMIGTNDALFYDVESGRYFTSDVESIKKSVNNLNRQMLTGIDNFISLNDFYYEIGLQPVKIGDDLGWRADSGLLEIDYSAQIASDGRPCLVINYVVAPQYDYQK